MTRSPRVLLIVVAAAVALSGLWLCAGVLGKQFETVSGASAAPHPTAATAPTKTIRAGRLTIGYRSIGTGRPVVLIMGLAGSIDAWQPSFLDDLAAQGRRVIVFDNEGVGRTTMRPGKLTIRRMGDDTAALIKALHLRRPDVMGWSMGGMIAQSFAVRHPDSVRRLVLMATSPGDGGFVVPRPDALALLAANPFNQLALLDQLFPPSQKAVKSRYIGEVASRRNYAPLAPQTTIDAQLPATTDWAAAKEPEGARVKRLKLPVLIGGGKLDHLLPVGNQRHLAKVIPGAKLVVYPDASHGFFYQHEKKFLRRVDAFLTP
jgi:pimeloyl-ACP methyl ester carboxylesterase